MDDTNITYRHNPVLGLPASLLAVDGQTVAVLSLMHRKGGLNRDLKRSLTARAKGAIPRLPNCPKATQTELELLSLYCSPEERFHFFWRCAWTRVSPQGPAGPTSFALGLDVPLLDAFCQDWWKLPLDEAALIRVCPAWPDIRERIKAQRPDDFKHWPLGVFMLWPKLLDELRRWDEIDQARRTTVARAIFSMSSIGYTDWFIRQAIELQPALGDELGDLVKADQAPEIPDGRAARQADARETPADWTSAWPGLMERLGQIHQTLSEQPTRKDLEALAALVADFNQWADALPSGEADRFSDCQERLKAVFAALHVLATEDGFNWLDEDLLSRVEARWSSALDSAKARDEELTRLTNDANTALSRGEEAARSYRQGLSECADLKRRLVDAENAVGNAGSFPLRRTLDSKRREVQQAVVASDAALQRLQDDLLSAWSPFAQPFDWAALEASLQGGPMEEPPGDSGAASPIPPEDGQVDEGHAEQSPTEEPPAQPPTEGSPSAPQTATIATDTPAGYVSEGHSATTTEVRLGSAPEPATLKAQAPQFNPEAGEACRPIWRALSAGRLSIAYQLAEAMAALPDSPLVPYPDLLGSVVLASRLLLPDGPVKQALAQRYERLDAAWFSEEAPSDWNQAMNLLLIGATLRPMLLTPDIGASTIAGYLHLHHHFRQLYQLTRSLRELSDKLQGIRIDPSTLKLVHSEALLDSQLSALGAEAHRWLHEQAPAVTIKFQAATNVWKSWLKPDGVISQLVTPVASDRRSEVATVRELIATLSDVDVLHQHVRQTDRKRRSKGEDIHSGALERLERGTDEALGIARRWVTLVESQGKKGDRTRTLLQEARSLVERAYAEVHEELSAIPLADEFGLIAAAAKVVAAQLAELKGLLDGTIESSPTEPSVREALAEGLLFIPSIAIEDDWSVSMAPADLVAAIREASPLSLQQVFEARVRSGDLHGAELLIKLESDAEAQQRLHALWRQSLEEFRSKFKKAVDEVRRDVEVGSAYGYLTEAGRVSAESLLVQWEAMQESLRRFDVGMKRVRGLQQEVASTREAKTAAIRKELANFPDTGDFREGKEEIERALALGDIQTANEFLQRIQQGKNAWPQREHGPDIFQSYFPITLAGIESWLGNQKPREVTGAIQQGWAIPGLDFTPVESAQRIQASKAYASWADMKSRQQTDRLKLEEVLRGLGFAVQILEQKDQRVAGREVWELLSAQVEDRNICPVPGFGSVAKGRYRVICLWQRPAEEDIVNAVGEVTQQRPTIVLYFGRMPERKWRETSLIAKRKRRSFLLVDEVMLVRLSAESGSRLAAFFHLTLPFTYSTPYDATAGLVAPEMFFGRAAELDAICGLNGRCFIYGGRQLGKTALLRRAEQSFHAPSLHRHAGWIDLRAEGIGVSRAPSEIWASLTDKLRDIGVLGAETPTPNPQKRNAIEAVIGTLRDFVLKGGDRRVLLLLDEADRFFEKDSHADFVETRRLKQLMETTDRRFKVVFAGLHNVLRMTEQANHPLAHLGEPIRIGPLIEEGELKEAEQLVSGPMAAAGFEFEARSLVIRILAQTNYYPSLVQLYCSHLLKHMLEKFGGQARLQGPRYPITDRDIEAVYSSGALRSEIRTKFRLTLNLDPRYELVAYVLAYEILRNKFPQGEGLEWQRIWQSAALRWWPEGFRGTSQLHFRNLLDEMVELGVLSRVGSNYTLRNPNVLLLLGTEDEVETVLVQDRELPVEFESATFHAPLRTDPAGRRRQPLTYQQIDLLTRRENRCMGVVGLSAAGISDVVSGLCEYLHQANSAINLDSCTDHVSFAHELKATLLARSVEGTTLVAVPPHAPWAANWVDDANAELKKLRSDAKYATVLFAADAATMWSFLRDSTSAAEPAGLSWLTLLPWHDGFVRHWLQEQHLPSEASLRKQISEATGFWPQLLYALTDGCSEVNELARRLEQRANLLATPEHASSLLRDFGLSDSETVSVLSPLAILEKPMTPAEIGVESNLPVELVERRLRWADFLGIVSRAGAEYWQIDPFIGKLLVTSAA